MALSASSSSLVKARELYETRKTVSRGKYNSLSYRLSLDFDEIPEPNQFHGLFVSSPRTNLEEEKYMNRRKLYLENSEYFETSTP